MTYLTLRENFHTGIDRIDEQHREMIECYNDLQRAVAMRQSLDTCDAAFRELISATQRHFAYEESLLKAHDYPDFEAHRAEHAELLRQIDDYEHRYRAGNLNLTPHTMALLKHWMVDHMVGSDQHFVSHIREAANA